MNQLIAYIFSAILTFILFRAIKSKANNWQLLVLCLLPTILIYLWNSNVRVYSIHGFMHTSIVYQIVNGYVPPNSPILAGEPLQYAWGHHLLVAGMVNGLHISPPTAFASINLVALLLTLILVYRIGIFFYSSRIAGIFAALLSIFGLNFALDSKSLIRQLGISHFELDFIIPAAKYSTINSMPLGILFFVLFLYSLLHIFEKPKNIWLYYTTLIISISSAGFFYPLIWLVLPPCCLAICCAIYLQHKQKALPEITGTIICLIAGIIIISPYLYQISSGKNGSTIALTPDLLHLIIKGIYYFWYILPISAVVLWKRKAFLNALNANTTSILIVLATTATTAMIYIFTSIVSEPANDYKYCVLSGIPLGIIASISLQEVYLRNRIICFLLVSSFLMPISYTWLVRFTPDEDQIVEPYIERERYLHHANPNEDIFYKWVSNQTEQNAIFLDTHLTIPVFGRRQLYIGLDTPQEKLDNNFRNGWAKSLNAIWETQGYSPKMIDKRRKVAQEIYSNTNNKISEEVVLELNKVTDQGDVYIVAREENANKKLAQNTAFKKVFDGDAAAIYQVVN